MFKLVVLSALVAVLCSAPAPGLLAAAPLAYSSAVIGSVPTSISHQSSSVVHSAAIAAPIVHAAPILRAAPIVHSAPLIAAAPAVYAHHGLAASPLISTVHGVHGVHGIHGGLIL